MYQITASTFLNDRDLYQIDFYIRCGNTGLELPIGARPLACEDFSALIKLPIFNEKTPFLGHFWSSSPVGNPYISLSCVA